MTPGRQRTGKRAASRFSGRLAGRLAARGAKRADDFSLAVLAWSERTGTERAVLSVERRLSGLSAALFGRRTVLGSLGGEEIAPGVMAVTLASRADGDGRFSELAVELVRGQGTPPGTPGPGVRWSVTRAPADPYGDEAAEALAVVNDWPDARQALIDYWGHA